jgi:hypothetical protein
MTPGLMSRWSGRGEEEVTVYGSIISKQLLSPINVLDDWRTSCIAPHRFLLVASCSEAALRSTSWLVDFNTPLFTAEG